MKETVRFRWIFTGDLSFSGKSKPRDLRRFLRDSSSLGLNSRQIVSQRFKSWLRFIFLLLLIKFHKGAKKDPSLPMSLFSTTTTLKETIGQALAPCIFGRLLCGQRACLSRTLYGDFIIAFLKINSRPKTHRQIMVDSRAFQ